jgi:hypothetical protein
VIISNHKIHDNGSAISYLYAENEEQARQTFKELSPQFELVEIEECDDE